MPDEADATTSSRTCYLVRHAIAEARGPAWPDDDRRPLSREGVKRMRAVVRGLNAIGVEVAVVATSPLVRARETAGILAHGLAERPAVEVLGALAPGRAPAVVARAAHALAARGPVALVGHEPGLGELAAWLIGTRRPVEFKKGGVCRIDLPGDALEGGGTLVWCAPPRILRAAGRPRG